MKKILFAAIALVSLFSMMACSDNETYADQRNRERDSINAFLRNEQITVITEKQFQERFDAGITPLTDTVSVKNGGKNEYVLIESNGVYMQILEQGCGDFIQKGTSQEVLVRFDEYNINTRAKICDASLQLSNKYINTSYWVDELKVTNTYGTFTGMFVKPARSVFAITYNSGTSGTVPSGWLVPFTWIKIGRGNGAGEKIAHVRLLIPHTYGSSTASANVNACLYDMTFQKGR